MARDELDLARRFEADLRRLKEQYPELATPAAQARLEEYLEISAEEEHAMPAKGARMMGEDTQMIGVRLPRSIIAMIDEHVGRMRREHPDLPINRVHALMNLIKRARAAMAAEVSDTVTDTTDEAAVLPVVVSEEPPPPVAPKPGKARRKKARV
jgi:hypothetical protein